MFTIEVMGKTIPVSEAIYRAYRRMMGTIDRGDHAGNWLA